MTEPSRTYFVRTFGCQMNEHDSERIAGLLEADGMRAVDRAEDADVVVLNTCTIRENADNKLYGHLGHLKSLKDARPGMQIAVGGCMAQSEQGNIQRRAPYVDAVLHPQRGRGHRGAAPGGGRGRTGHGHPRRSRGGGVPLRPPGGA